MDRMAPRVIAAETIAAISYSANSLSSHPRRFGTVGTPGNVHPGNFGVVLLASLPRRRFLSRKWSIVLLSDERRALGERVEIPLVGGNFAIRTRRDLRSSRGSARMCGRPRSTSLSLSLSIMMMMMMTATTTLSATRTRNRRDAEDPTNEGRKSERSSRLSASRPVRLS